RYIRQSHCRNAQSPPKPHMWIPTPPLCPLCCPAGTTRTGQFRYLVNVVVGVRERNMPERAQPSLIGRTVDYIFGRNTLIGVASFMLLIISGYATWHGMRDFIVGVSSTATAPTGGGISISNDVLVIAVVVALTFLMWLTLRETFGAKRRLRERLITFPLYVFLAIWSIGFGYGFWWSLISGEEATRTGLAGLQEDARDASAVVAARLEAVRG